MPAKNVQIEESARICVLVHKDTKRILCFCRNDNFASSFERKGYQKVEIFHAHDYDKWAKRLREQARAEDEAKDYIYLERENTVRQRLRSDLRRHLAHANGPERQAIDSALHCLDYAEAKRRRYRAETFMLNESYEATKNPGEEIIDKLMAPKASPAVRKKAE